MTERYRGLQAEKDLPSPIEVVRSQVEEVLGISLTEMLEAYIQENEDGALTEADLVSEILEAGGYQAEISDSLDDAIVIGLTTIAGPLGLLPDESLR